MIIPEAGISMLEMLFSLVLFAIMGLGLSYSSISASHAQGRNERNSLAMQIGLETLEDFTGRDPETLSDADDTINESISRGGYAFLRSIDVTIEFDRTRTVDVTIRNVAMNITANFSSSFALWNRR